MKKNMKKAFTLFCAAAIVLTLFGSNYTSLKAAAATAQDLADYINEQSGLIAAIEASGVVNVSGTRYTATTALTLEIPSGVTLNWHAELTGTVKNAYLLNLTGDGKFILDAGGSVSNSGVGGQINAAGAGLTVNIPGELKTTSNGISLNISANNIEVNVTGTIENYGSNSAINVAPNVTGVKINVAGGDVISTTGGYAINDGGGVSGEKYDNNTLIMVTAGSWIESGSACAIRSSGTDSAVTITDSTVKNNAGSNTNSTIYMNCSGSSGGNVTVNGNSHVFTDNTGTQSYVIQATGNVTVTDTATVSAINGRAINLVGMNSVATVNGSAVVETINGTAISTATTTLDNIVNARVEIEGGVVRATGTGTAIRITGDNGRVNITGGWVTARQGFAVDASGRPPIGSVTVSGGFVFSWGDGISKVVTPSSTKLIRSSVGIVVAWNTTTGDGIYYQLEDTDLIVLPLAATAVWDNGSPDDGIRYANGANTGFFPLEYVDVITTMFTLTVVNGTPSSLSVRAGDVVTIEADPGEPIKSTSVIGSPTALGNEINGTAFSTWSSNNGGVFGNADASLTTFTMPANNVTITASYSPRYLLDVRGGRISSSYTNLPNPTLLSANYGYYQEGAVIIIEGNTTPPNFVRWNFVGHAGETWRFANNATLITTFTMPGSTAVIEPTFVGVINYPTPYEKLLIVKNGVITRTNVLTLPNVSSYSCLTGTTLFIEAEEIPGYMFDKWVKTDGDGSISDTSNPSTTFLMGSTHSTIEATYKSVHILTVVDGTGSGSYEYAKTVPITVAGTRTGQEFSGWTIDGGGGEFNDSSSPNTTFTMPDCDAEISAHYEWLDYSLTVVDGIDGSGVSAYHYGEEVAIIADDPPVGKVFIRWTVSVGGGFFANVSSAATTYTMPASDVTVTALYGSPYVPDAEPDDDKVEDDDEEPDKEPDDNPDIVPASIALNAITIVSGDGAELTAGQFDFAIYDEDNNLVSESKNNAGGDIEFDPIAFTQAGVYTYKIIETSLSGSGWITDGREYFVTVIVTNDNNALTATVVYPDGNVPVFHNRYSKAAAEAAKTADEDGKEEGEDSPASSFSSPFTTEHIAYIFGYPDGTVRPGQNITRAEVALIFHRLLTDELRDTVVDAQENPFTDVLAGRWYSSAISVMNGLGIINGYEDGTFKPDGAITRAELSAISARFALMMGMAPINHAGFSDIGGHWAESDIMYAAEIGWINGFADETFAPDRNITRAEFITLVNRMLERIPESADDLIFDGMIQWADNADQDEWFYLAVQEASNSHISEFKEKTVPGLRVNYEYWVEIKPTDG